MTSLAAEKIGTLPGLHTCFTCADNLGCNLEPRSESMAGCIKWRCYRRPPGITFCVADIAASTRAGAAGC